MPKNNSVNQAIHDKYLEARKKVRTLFAQISQALAIAFQYLRAVPSWGWAAIIIVFGIYVGSLLEEKHAFLDFRYKAHQWTQKFGSKLKGDLYDHNTVVVLIDDDDFWKGSYQGRRPVDKKSLADLIRKLDSYNPRVIALDFDLRSPIPDGSLVEYPQYVKDSKEFADVIKDVSSRRRVILPKTINYDGSWTKESDRYDGQDLGTARFGYIVLSYDYRQIPVSVELKDGSRIDSFCQAIVRAFDLTGNALQFDRQDHSLTYAGPYLYEEEFEQYSAGEVLNPDSSTHNELLDKLLGKIVIVGGAWSRSAYERGERIDERDTPAGKMPAVFLHANWVESVLQQRTARPVSKWIAMPLEVILGFLGYYVFTRRMRWYRKAAYIVGVGLFWFIVAYVSAQNLGLFFDPITPTVISLGKAIYEEIAEWKKDANKYHQLQKLTEVKKEVANAAA